MVAVKKASELAGASADLWKRGKAAADANNRDYAISIILGLVKAESAFMEGRQTLRALAIQRYKAQSAIARQLGGVKTAAGAMKASGLVKKSPAEALAAAEDVLAVDPYNGKATEVLIEAAALMHLPQISILGHETLADAKPDDKKNLHQLAQLCMRLEDYERAIGVYERLLRIDPRDGDAQGALKNATARLASSSGGWEKADDFRGALKNKDQSIQLEQESKVVKSAAAIESEIARLSKLVEEHPDNLTHPKQIAALYLQDEDFASAIAWYEYVYDKGGRNDASLEKTISGLRLKQVDRQITEAREAAAQSGDPAQAAYLAEMIQYRKQLNLQTAFDRVQRYPSDKQLHFELGAAYESLGMYREALPELQQGKQQPSVRLEASNLLGVCHWKLNMLDLAERGLSQAAAEIPIMNDTKKEILYNLAGVLQTAGKKEQEIEMLKQIYEVDIGYRDVAARVEGSYGL